MKVRAHNIMDMSPILLFISKENPQKNVQEDKYISNPKSRNNYRKNEVQKGDTLYFEMPTRRQRINQNNKIKPKF